MVFTLDLLLIGLVCVSAFPRQHHHNLRKWYSEAEQHQFDSLPIPGPVGGNRVRATAPSDVYLVTDYGAKGDNSTDNTAAFNAALQAAKATAGTVYAPPGDYRFNDNIAIPSGVTLLGSYMAVPSHDCRRSQYPGDGTTLMPLANRGNASAPPFIVVNPDASLKGVVIWHVEQLRAGYPTPYPFAVSLIGANAAVQDVEILNAYNGIRAVGAARHYIARVQGQPLNIGVYIDSTYDIGRIEDVHFNPWFSIDKEFMSHQVTQGRAFVFGRSDWEYVFNTFAFAYAYGYHFIKTPTGTMNGNFVGIGADYACNASVQVDAAQAPGLLIVNGEFTAFHNQQFAPNATSSPAQIVVAATNIGPVNLVDSSFWGPSENIARIDGQGVTSFNSCIFSGWDRQKLGKPAIQANSGSLIVSSSEFQEPQHQIQLEANVSKAVIVGNIIAGPMNITNNGVKNFQKGFNAADD
eukprot:TRINITY_DN9947_c0_g1_i3.p1 TRINITY_DN9947_c0_g1~~TRINITY_DN9947_c0_g1_i3.p1  ORF type:complete len:472 (+),score=92.94 TRINITY_DN9947_c0_g1_i3:26-1417(+)